VVRERDGFEVFFGVDGSKALQSKAAKAKVAKDARDGFDKFYGIPRPGDGEESPSSPMAQRAEEIAQQEGQRLLQQQLHTRLGGGQSSTSDRARSGSGSAAGVGHDVPAGVPTYSMANEPVLPAGVQSFSLCQH